MFKKLLLLTALFAGLSINNATAAKKETISETTTVVNENGDTTTTTITTQDIKDDGGVLVWLKHFGVAWLCYKGEVLARAAVILPLCCVTSSPRRQDEMLAKFLILMGLTYIPGKVAAYKMTNHFHEQMSEEPYRWAHLLGAIL